MYISGDNSFLIQQTKGVSAMETPFVFRNYKLGGVSSISGTLTSVSGAFPTFVI